MSREAWIKDIFYLKEKIQKTHPNPYLNFSKDEFEKRIKAMIDRVQVGDLFEIEMMIRRFVADIGDMHTTTININEGCRLPLEIKFVDDEFRIIKTDEFNRKLQGYKVEKINDIPIEEIFKKIKSIIPNENETYKNYEGEKYLSSPEILEIIGLKDVWNGIGFSIQNDEGVISRVNIMPTMKKEKYESPFKYKYMEDQKSLYIKCGVCMDNSYMKKSGISGDEKIPDYYDFIQNIFELIEGNDVCRVIFDIRDNKGGQLKYPKYLFLKLLESKKWNEKINKKGNFFVLINNGVVSAGVETCKYLKKSTEAIFVGEATGGNIKSFGVTLGGEVKLPNSKINLRCSSEKWSGYLEGINKNFEPDIFIKPSFEEIINKEDPVIKYICSSRE